MFDQGFTSIYGTSDSLVSTIGTGSFLICCAASIILGAIVALIYMFRHKYTKSFVVTLALLPLIVQMVITLVNGNLGAGIAVMGVFNLVRFRSIPGSARDIGSVFLAMAIGLATGMGFLGLAVVFTIVVSVMNVVLTLTPFGKEPVPERTLKISIPEEFDYEAPLATAISKYASKYELVSIETANMGALYNLTYNVNLRDDVNTKIMIDEIRTLNGNLKVSLNLKPAKKETL